MGEITDDETEFFLILQRLWHFVQIAENSCPKGHSSAESVDIRWHRSLMRRHLSLTYRHPSLQRQSSL